MKTDELQSIGLAAALILANIGLMGVLSKIEMVPVLLNTLFTVPVLGMVVFGAALAGGRYLARRGIRRKREAQAYIGAGLLQLTYGVFGGAILYGASTAATVMVLGVTGVITTVIAVLAAAAVYGTGRDFEHWRSYSNYIFFAGIGTGLLGSFFRPLLLLTFVLVLTGFVVYLVFEIWRMKQRPQRTILNGIGIYVAYMGVFIHILQIVMEILGED